MKLNLCCASSHPGHRHRWLLTCFSLLCCVWLITANSFAAEDKTGSPVKRQVVILPFTVEIPGSYTYLKHGLASTLASRLSTRANVAAVAQGSTSDQMAAALKEGNHAVFGQLLRQSGAEYMAIGSLTPKNNQFELACYVFSQNSAQPPRQFVQNFTAVDDAMQAIDELAWDISGTIFSKPRPEIRDAARQPSGLAAFQTAHPERAYREGQYAGMTTGLEAGGLFTLANTLRSRPLPVQAMDINAGDLDGDGKDEVVLLTTTSLMIYRYDDSQFRMLATVNLPNHIRYHSVTLGDLNQNGLQEIYISGSNGDLPDATAMEWDGRRITTLFEHARWYLRTMSSPGETPVLLGQRSLAEDLGGGDIFEMDLDAQNTLTERKRLNIPKGLSVFDFVLADLDGSGSKVLVAINNQNRLQLYDTAGSVRWTSPDTFGASNNFFGTLTSANNAASSEKEPVWIRTRIVIADLDGDHINDILVGRNRLETVPFMPNLRYFAGSSLAAFKWDRFSLIRLWETKKIPGYITNYQVLRADPGSTEYSVLFAEAETSYPFIFWQSASAYLNSYTLQVNLHGSDQSIWDSQKLPAFEDQ
ncbi:MAG: VCBS repeat-containing protein [Desulfobulbus sp.]|nr:VCBS repeat-containing protein [Desulfobulbus sp.]